MHPQRAATPQGENDFTQPARPAWNPEQLVRLEHDWRRLQRAYAYHPVVRVVPLSGNPPAEYQIEYTCRALYVREDGQLDYLTNPAVHVWLPPTYPHEAPVVRPLQAIFHPNMTGDGVGLIPPWSATTTLVDLVRAVGAMLSYQSFDVWNPWNPAAVEWTNANAAYLPVDHQANFAPDGDTDPLERICRSGPDSLTHLREQLQDLCASMVSTTDPPSADEVYTFAEQIRLATGLFLDDDVPGTLREPATTLDEWAQALPQTVMLFEGLRQRHISSASALGAAGKVAEARRVLIKELTNLEHLASDKGVTTAAHAQAALPEASKMQAMQASLRVVTANAQKRLETAKVQLSLLRPPDPRGTQTLSEVLEARIEAEIERAAQAIAEAMEKTRSAIETITPTIERAVDELTALERAIGWRDLTDLTAKAQRLADQLVASGSAGMQAYSIQNEGGKYGPYEFEQRLDFGPWTLAVRNTGAASIEVLDINTGKVLGRNEHGAIKIALADPEGNTFPTVFRMVSRCDDLWIRVEYLTRQIGDQLIKLAKVAASPKAHSWASSFDRLLSATASLAAVAEQTRKDVIRRNAIVSDLKALAPFKERLTTQFLLERHETTLSEKRSQMRAAQKALAEANDRIAYIFARSQRDAENGQPMVPPKFAKEYETNKIKRDQARATIDHGQAMMDQAAAQIAPRLANPTLYGSDMPPVAKVMPPLPDDLLARAELLSEEAMSQQIARLSAIMEVEIRPETFAPHGATANLAPPDATSEAATEGEGEIVNAEFAEEAPIDLGPPPEMHRGPSFEIHDDSAHPEHED